MYKHIKTFVALFILGFSMSHASGAAILLDRVIAVVNQEVITWSELYKMMEYEASDQVKALNETERTKVFKKNEAVFLEKLIDMRLQLQQAKKVGLNVGSEEVTEAVESIKKKYSLTDKALEESLKKEGMAFEEYKKRISEQILVSKFLNQQIRNKIIISDEEVKKYIEENKGNLNDTDAFKLRLIFIKKPENDAGKKAAEEKGALIIQRLKAGEDFSALAREYSDDPSGKLGGDIGYIKRDILAKEFISTLSGMKPGDFSNPFWTGKGLHIIKLEEKTGAQNIDEIEENLRKQFAEERFMEKYDSLIKDLREQAHIEIRL